jgi:hypothetical protein
VHCFPRTAPRSRWSSSPTVASGSSPLVVVLARDWTALGAPARSWRLLGEVERTACYSSFFLLTA